MRILPLLVLWLGACGQENSVATVARAEDAPREATAAADPIAPPEGLESPVEPESPARPRPMVGAGVDQTAILDHIANARPIRFKPVGSTSIVYQMTLRGDVDAAFKPATVEHPRGHLAEIAAYRLARLLGLDNVPPAVTRRVYEDRLHARLHPDFEDSWPHIVDGTLWDDRRRVTGAAIYWIPAMRNLGLERRGSMGRWTRALRQSGVVPTTERARHADLSRMVAFDFLIANWDRWSGGNAQGTPDGRRLFIRDHNVAFAAPLSPALHGRVLGHLTRTEKFSRSFVHDLARLTEPALRAELARDPGAEDGLALDARQLREVMRRRRTLLSYVASLIDAHGEERVLAFP